MGGIEDLSGQKEITETHISLTTLDSSGTAWHGPSFPMDSQAKYVYFSKTGGISPVKVAATSIFDNPFHYGAGFFEGVRIFNTPYGPSFVELSSNIARLTFSSLTFNQALIRRARERMGDDVNIDHIEHVQRTAREFFADAAHTLRNGGGISAVVSLVYKNGERKEVKLPVTLEVVFPEGIRELAMKEFAAAMCSLAFLSRLVRTDASPDGLELAPAGYFRPFAWTSGEQGLRIPSMVRTPDSRLVEKPFYFGIGTLPWGTYLPEEGYRQGLDVVLAPLPRIDESMPVTTKVSGCYVNSTININIALLFGFGEIITLNHADELVEGSAENLIFLFTNKKTGEMVAKSPPLSSNILAGTNRHRCMQILEDGIVLDGRRIKHELKAPSLEHVIACLEGKTKWELSSIVMVGTGVDIIHVRSITLTPGLRDWLRLNELRSEEEPPNPVILRRPEETSRRFVINNGKQHPVIAALKQRRDRLVLGNNGALLTPAYSMDFEVAAQMFRVELGDAASTEFISAVHAGKYQERVNGLQQPDECRARYREAAAVIGKMLRLRMDRHKKMARRIGPTF